MTAEAALVDEPLRRAVERKAEVLEIDDRLDRVVAHHARRVLVDEIVAALHGVEPVPLPVVLLRVAEGGAHPALGGAGVGARGIELADDADAGLRPEVLLQLERRVEARPARADDEAVEVVDADAGRPRQAGRAWRGPSVRSREWPDRWRRVRVEEDDHEQAEQDPDHRHRAEKDDEQAAAVRLAT